METKKTPCQPPAEVANPNAHRCQGAGRITKTIAAIICSGAVLVAAGVPAALSSVPPRGRPVAQLELGALGAKNTNAKPNSPFVASQLAEPWPTGIGVGIVLGMENFLRAFPPAVPIGAPALSNDTDVSAQLGHLMQTTGFGAGITLGMENFLRAFPVTVFR